MSLRSLILLAFLCQQTGCAGLQTGRTYLSEMERDDSSFYNPSEDFPIVAGDSGRNWMSDEERQYRTPASEDIMADDKASRALKAELRELESMQSEESMELYGPYKNLLGSVSQRIYFLRLPPHERKDYLITRGIISEARTNPVTAYEKMAATRANDVIIGMEKNDVLESLGKPIRVEVAGNPRNENERWLYRLNGSSKYIYFESGKVQGWE